MLWASCATHGMPQWLRNGHLIEALRIVCLHSVEAAVDVSKVSFTSAR